MPNHPAPIRRAALHYRIWREAEARAWNLTLAELADALDLPMATVRNVCVARDWTHRLRVMAVERADRYLREEHLEDWAA